MLADTNRKLDVGILKDIKSDKHNQWMKEHNQHLEKILGKLAER